MFSAFSTALSGLNAMTTAIDVVGNNLANLNTSGYKDQTVSFQDLVAASLSGNSATQVGLGTSQPYTAAQFIQGTIQTTDGSFDGAINGAGFFVVKDPNGQDLYTRDGGFQLDKNGYLTTTNGDRVQGWLANAQGAINASGALSDIQVPIGQSLPAIPTSNMSTTINLNASTPDGGNWSTGAINVVDSLGNSTPLSISFTKTPNSPGTWSYAVTGTGVTVAGGTGTLQFDSSGNLVTPAAPGNIALSLSGFSDGASAQTVNWSLYNAQGVSQMTQYTEADNLAAASHDGQPAAVLTGVSLQNGGNIVATYSNGAQQQTVAQLALASIRNPQSLQDVGSNNYSLTGSSAAPTIGASGTGGLGVIDGGSIENSTVDIATEFSHLLTFERSYQADSRVITVSDEMTQDAVGLIK